MHTPFGPTPTAHATLSRRSFLQAGGALLLGTTLATQSRPLPLAAETAAQPTARYPFPHHTAYTAGTIRPNHKAQKQLDQATQKFYRQWRGKYLCSGCGKGRYYVLPAGEGGGKDRNSISISEGHGYGMLLMALLAGYEPQAKQIFDGMYAFFLDHPSEINPNLMAWNQVRGCRNTADADAATDGDMDIAYALLLADAQWGSSGTINYRQAAIRIIEQGLLASIVNLQFHHLMLGDWAAPDEPTYYYATRPSDFMVEHLRLYHAATGNAQWQTVQTTCYDLIARMQRVYSPNTGLLPDFIQNLHQQPRPADPGFLEEATDGDYGYNACRTPWRIATDYLLAGDGRALQGVNKMNGWMKQQSAGDPTRIRAGYRLNGTNVDGNDYLAMAFVAPLGVGAMVDPTHQNWLNAIWDTVVAQPLNQEDYYGNTLKLLAMIVMSGNWWSPTHVSAQDGNVTQTDAAAIGETVEAAFPEIEMLERETMADVTTTSERMQTVFLPLVAQAQ